MQWVGVCDGNTCILFLESPEFFLSSVGSSVSCLYRIIFHSLSILIILETILHLLGSVSRKALTCCETVSLSRLQLLKGGAKEECLHRGWTNDSMREFLFGLMYLLFMGRQFLMRLHATFTTFYKNSRNCNSFNVFTVYQSEIRMPESATCNRWWNLKPFAQESSRPARGLVQRIFDMSKVE